MNRFVFGVGIDWNMVELISDRCAKTNGGIREYQPTSTTTSGEIDAQPKFFFGEKKNSAPLKRDQNVKG